MPQFTSSPALRARSFDLQDIQRRGLKNQLLQSKLQEYGAAQQQQNQLRGVMGGVGAEAGLGPNAQQALRIDPGMLGELMKIPKAERDRAKEQATTLGNLALGVLTAPPIQRTAMWGQAREAAIASGANPQNVPEIYDQGVEVKLRQWVAQAGKIKTLLDQVPDTPSGYRSTEGGLEFTPGGPADPAQAGRLAAANRVPDKPTMSKRKVALLRKWRGAQEGRGKWNDTDQAEWDMIIQADPMDILRRNMLRAMGRTPATTTPDSDAPSSPAPSVDEPNWIEQGYNYLFGSDADAGPPTPGGNGAVTPVREIDSPTRPLPRTASGKVDAKRLKRGQTYEAADLTLWRWDGKKLTQVAQ